jgi:hypothetical protein
MSKHGSKKKERELLFETNNETIIKTSKTLDEIWNRIGFTEESKFSRLQIFFDKISVSFST